MKNIVFQIIHFYSTLNVLSAQKPPHQHRLPHRCSHARNAAVRAILVTLLHAPHREHLRIERGCLPNCTCLTESMILSKARPPSTIGNSGQNFNESGSMPNVNFNGGLLNCNTGDISPVRGLITGDCSCGMITWEGSMQHSSENI